MKKSSSAVTTLTKIFVKTILKLYVRTIHNIHISWIFLAVGYNEYFVDFQTIIKITHKKLLEEEGLNKHCIPIDPIADEPETLVFASKEFFRDAAKKPLLILIHGNGAVRAGQWSRR